MFCAASSGAERFQEISEPDALWEAIRARDFRNSLGTFSLGRSCLILPCAPIGSAPLGSHARLMPKRALTLVVIVVAIAVVVCVAAVVVVVGVVVAVAVVAVVVVVDWRAIIYGSVARYCARAIVLRC